MFSGIFTILQISSAIIKQQSYFEPTSLQLNSDQQITDKAILNVFNDDAFDNAQYRTLLGTGQQLCDNILEESKFSDDNNINTTPLEKFHQTFHINALQAKYITDPDFIFFNQLPISFYSGCALNKNDSTNYRLIIIPPNNSIPYSKTDNSYAIFSCMKYTNPKNLLLKPLNDDKCIFEESKQN